MGQPKTNPLNGSALTYYIFEGVLIGRSGGTTFHLLALSGGGGGSTAKPQDFGGGFYPYLTGKKTTGTGVSHVHGGPIPPGRYIIHPPSQNPHLGLSAFLEPYGNGQMMDRSGFYIHGRGPHGSDGCIVPLENFKPLMDAIAKDGGGTLFVQEAMGGARFA